MIRLILLSLLLAGTALAQDAEVVRQPLDPALGGRWELVEMILPDADIEVVRFALTFDGNEVTVDRAVRIGEEVREEAYTVECYEDADRVIGCLPSEDGAAGYGGLGRYEVDGDTLRLSMPETDYYAVFRRVVEE